MATMEDVAKAAKVSRATVSRVLSNYPSIKPETRQQVMYWVRELHYEPNQVAQNLAGHHTNLIVCYFRTFPTRCMRHFLQQSSGRRSARDTA